MAAVDERTCNERHEREAERHERVSADLTEIKGDVKSLVTLMRGANSKPGLVDDVRDLKKWRENEERGRKTRIGIVVSIILIFLTQVAVLCRLWIWK